MTIHDLLFKLYTVGDCSILDSDTRKAVKDAARLIAEVRTTLNLGSAEDPETILIVARELAKGSIP